MSKRQKQRPSTRPRRPGEEKALSRLLQLLESGSHPPGTRLPSERKLCEYCGVSRMTLRRALKRLIDSGRLNSHIGCGTFVTRPPEGSRRPVVTIMYSMTDILPQRLFEYACEKNCALNAYSQSAAKWSPKSERRFLRSVRDQQQRALLAFCTPIKPHSEALLRDLEHSGVRILHVEHYRMDPPEQAYILPDFRRAGHMAAVDLMIAGYRNLFWVGCLDNHVPFEDLSFQGFRDALLEHRPDLAPDRQRKDYPTVGDGPHHRRRAIEAQIRAFSSLPPNTGLVVSSFAHAESLAETLATAGFSIPDDIGLIGLDTSWFPKEDTPSSRVDVLSFNRTALLEQALDAVLAPEWLPPCQTVMPSRIRCGSVR